MATADHYVVVVHAYLTQVLTWVGGTIRVLLGGNKLPLNSVAYGRPIISEPIRWNALEERDGKVGR